ncbi:MAG: hypothetical protein EBU36_04045 [Verrucomicrobia bacterium]|nr:hypothetical protein [Verrucomicrobiota bacterium]
MSQERILFNAGAKVEVVSGKGGPIPKENLLAVFIKELRVDPRTFLSKDLGPNREGVVELIISGQPTILPYSGTGPVHEKYLRRVAYLGRNPGALGISVAVTESDEESRRLLDKASGIAEALSGALPGRGTPWGVILGPIAPAFGLIASLLRFLRGGVDDDEEARVFATTEQSMAHGSQISVKFNRKGKEVFSVLLEVEDLGAPTNQAGGFSVRIARPELFLEDVEIGVRKGSVRSPKKGWMSRPDAGLSPVKSGEYLRRMKWFGCQASSGIARFQYETLRSESGEVLTWNKAEIFQAAAPKLKSDRHCLPLTLSFSLYPDRAELSPLVGVASSGVELVQDLLEGSDDKKGKALLADVAPYVRKSAPSVAALLSEISEGRFSLFSMEGFLVLLPKGQKGSMDPESPRLMLEWVEADEVWRGTMHCKLEWRGVRVGQFSFGIEVAEI